MNTVHRQYAKVLHKGGEDDAKVTVLLQEYNDADKVLEKLLNASKEWRDAWFSIATVQLDFMVNLDDLYNPNLGGAGEGYVHEPAATPRQQMEQIAKLRHAYAELKKELLEEIAGVDARIIRPLTDAREYIQPMRKVIKKRENRRLDYERYRQQVDNIARKSGQTDKDAASLVKAEVELSKATDDFRVADAHVREALPPIVDAVVSLIPHIMAAYILIQNSLLAQYYTTVHEYCQSQGFPSPSPPMDHITADWKQNFDPARNEVESITLVARGKAVHKPMQLSTQESKSYTGLGIRSHTSSAASSAVAAVRGSSNKESSNGESKSYTGLGIRSHTSSAASSAVAAVRGGRDKIPSSSDSRLQRLPSSNSISPTSPDNRVMRIPSNNTLSSPTLSDTAQRISNGRPSHLSPAYTPRMEDVATASNALSKADYFTGLADRTRTQGTVQSPTSPSMSEAIAKKKPPPPPPKRTPSREPETWVAAIYDFSGQEQGDLSFRAGDRIKVLMQTGDKNDWWDGELNGRKGKFPANYCE